MRERTAILEGPTEWRPREAETKEEIKKKNKEATWEEKVESKKGVLATKQQKENRGGKSVSECGGSRARTRDLKPGCFPETH